MSPKDPMGQWWGPRHTTGALVGSAAGLICMVHLYISSTYRWGGLYDNVISMPTRTGTATERNASVNVQPPYRPWSSNIRDFSLRQDPSEKDLLQYWRNTSHIFYNRVPKCGSTTTNNLLGSIARKNNFTFHHHGIFPRWPTYYFADDAEKAKFLKWFFQCKGRCVSEAHEHYIDFDSLPPEYGAPTSSHVTYFNLIRDPLAHRISLYYFFRFTHKRPMDEKRRSMTFDECVTLDHPDCTSTPKVHFFIPYFCGQEAMCRMPGRASLDRAMRTVLAHHAVVGYLENMGQFYQALEWALPDWFKGLSQLFRNRKKTLMKGKKTNKTMSEMNTQKMKTLLKYDYEFYAFIKQHFYQQFQKVLS